MPKKRGSLWNALLGAAVLAFGAFYGMPRWGVSGLLWTLVGAVLLGYNVWAMLRRSGGRPPREFPMPDPAQAEAERQELRRKLRELEEQFNAGEIGYEEYTLRRRELFSESSVV